MFFVSRSIPSFEWPQSNPAKDLQRYNGLITLKNKSRKKTIEEKKKT